MDNIVHDGKLTLERLEAVFRDERLLVDRLDGNRLEVHEQGKATVLHLHPNQRLLVLYFFWKLPPHVTEQEQLAFVNQLNTEYNFVRFGFDNQSQLWCDHVLYAGHGITTVQLLATFRRFRQTAASAFGSESARHMQRARPSDGFTRVRCAACSNTMRVPDDTMPREGSINVRCPSCKKVLKVTAGRVKEPIATQAVGTDSNVVTALKQLAELRDAGLVTDEEFAAKKSEILARL